MKLKLKRFDQFVAESIDRYDMREPGAESNCCGAPMDGDICTDCGEHAEALGDENDDDFREEQDHHEPINQEEEFGDEVPNEHDHGYSTEFDDDEPVRHDPDDDYDGLDDDSWKYPESGTHDRRPPVYEKRKVRRFEDDEEEMEEPKKKKAPGASKFPNLKPFQKKGTEKPKEKEVKGKKDFFKKKD